MARVPADEIAPRSDHNMSILDRAEYVYLRHIYVQQILGHEDIKTTQIENLGTDGTFP